MFADFIFPLSGFLFLLPWLWLFFHSPTKISSFSLSIMWQQFLLHHWHSAVTQSVVTLCMCNHFPDVQRPLLFKQLHMNLWSREIQRKTTQRLKKNPIFLAQLPSSGVYFLQLNNSVIHHTFRWFQRWYVFIIRDRLINSYIVCAREYCCTAVIEEWVAKHAYTHLTYVALHEVTWWMVVTCMVYTELAPRCRRCLYATSVDIQKRTIKS